MNYEEWLKSTEFAIKRKYKINKVEVNDNGDMIIHFENGFNYAVNKYYLMALHQNGGFEELSKDIEREYLLQIMKW